MDQGDKNNNVAINTGAEENIKSTVDISVTEQKDSKQEVPEDTNVENNPSDNSKEQNNIAEHIEVKEDVSVSEDTAVKQEIAEENVDSNVNNNTTENGNIDEKKDEVQEGSKDVEDENDGPLKYLSAPEEIEAKEQVEEEQVTKDETTEEVIEIKEETVSEIATTSLDTTDQGNANDIIGETGQDAVQTEEPAPQPMTHGNVGMDPEIRAHLEKYLNNNGITNYNINMEPGSKVGDNMLGIILKVTINGTDKDGSITELNWIVKIAPEIEILRKMINMHALFENESTMYETVFPIFKELENEKSIRIGFDAYPRFLFSYMAPLKETIAMQDMKALGYVLRNKKEPLNLDHVKLVMKTYGKFHALSYAFKYSKPDLFESLGAKFIKTFSDAVDTDILKQSQQAVIDNALSLLDPKRDCVAFKKYSKYAANFMDIYLETCMKTNEYSIICHGDSWINNMLFKYDNPSNPNIPTDVCLLDFQVARFASPASDLSYFIFTCTSKAFRDEHYDNMIQLYYYTLCGYLNDLGFDPEKCLSFDALLAEIKRYSIIGLYMSLLALVAMTTDTDELQDANADDSVVFMMKGRNKEDYNERIRNIIIDFAQKGYFDFLF